MVNSSAPPIPPGPSYPCVPCFCRPVFFRHVASTKNLTLKTQFIDDACARTVWKRRGGQKTPGLTRLGSDTFACQTFAWSTSLLAKGGLPKIGAKCEPQTFFDKRRTERFGSEQTSRVASCRERSFSPSQGAIFDKPLFRNARACVCVCVCVCVCACVLVLCVLVCADVC